jgi:threonine dehydrogenase-like Zn-dependent dehydrogenase
MKTRGAIVRQAPGKYEVVDLDVDDPRQGEIRVKMVASGLCHSDDHIATGDIPVGTYPFAGGHEGGGIVESVGPNTPGFAPGNKVIFSFLPACGRCRWCATGHQNLCDLGAGLLVGARWTDRPASAAPRRRHPGRPDVRPLHLLRVHHGRGGLHGQGPRGHPAGGGLTARLQRGHRLGLVGEHRRGAPG